MVGKNGSDNEEYKIRGVVRSDEVPNWARRPPKWQGLIDAIAQLQPGQSLTVAFPSRNAANRARNTVRDNVNLIFGQAVIRTRVVIDPQGEATVFFTRLHPNQVVEEEREEPAETDTGTSK